MPAIDPETQEVAPGVAHENLEGWIPALENEEDLRVALEKAFDYRGDITLTLKNGTKLDGSSSPGIKFPSAAQSGIKIKLDRAIPVGDSTTTRVVDFDLENSFIMRGSSLGRDGLLFKPTIKASLTRTTTTTP